MGEKIVGFVIEGYDNDTYMFEPNDETIQRCPYCRYRLNFFETNVNYKFAKTFSPSYMDVVITPQSAFSVTYDGQLIVSKKFKEFCLYQNYTGLTFIDLPADKEHFHLIVSTEIKVDIVRGNTRFEKLCPVCDNYASVTQGYEFLQVQNPLLDGFYRTDLLFGSRDAKSPAIIVGSKTKLKLERAMLEGFEFEPAYGLE